MVAWINLSEIAALIPRSSIEAVPTAAPAPTRTPHPETEEDVIMATAMMPSVFSIFPSELFF